MGSNISFLVQILITKKKKLQKKIINYSDFTTKTLFLQTNHTK